jgi:hypothetical protein
MRLACWAGGDVAEVVVGKGKGKTGTRGGRGGGEDPFSTRVTLDFGDAYKCPCGVDMRRPSLGPRPLPRSKQTTQYATCGVNVMLTRFEFLVVRLSPFRCKTFSRSWKRFN